MPENSHHLSIYPTGRSYHLLAVQSALTFRYHHGGLFPHHWAQPPCFRQIAHCPTSHCCIMSLVGQLATPQIGLLKATQPPHLLDKYLDSPWGPVKSDGH